MAAEITTAVSATTTDDVEEGTITGSIDDAEVGHLDYDDYPANDGSRRVRIKLVVVDPDHRRQGVATALVAALREQVPLSTLSPPALNNDGRGLMAAIFDRFAEPISQGPN
jgi:GNAT superfamily N-acetyltransferase